MPFLCPLRTPHRHADGEEGAQGSMEVSATEVDPEVTSSCSCRSGGKWQVLSDPVPPQQRGGCEPPALPPPRAPWTLHISTNYLDYISAYFLYVSAIVLAFSQLHSNIASYVISY